MVQTSSSRLPGRFAILRPVRLVAVVAGLWAVGGASAIGGQTASEPAASPEIRKFCTNIAVAAGDARFAWQTGKLNELETRIKARIQDLDAKEAEVRGWIEKRDAIEKQASDKLVGIYSKMKPETAASQISTLDDDMAAAVLGQLSPQKASAIFNEIVPERAAKLAGLIAAVPPVAAPVPDKKL
jgi:flagellar motility protein MotE (MotC chaperone)